MTAAGLTSHDVARRAGISYRQLDYWARKGAIAPSIAEADGPGNYRRWSHLDEARLTAISQVATDLAALGIDEVPLKLAAQLWQRLADYDDITICQGTLTICVSRPRVRR